MHGASKDSLDDWQDGEMEPGRVLHTYSPTMFSWHVRSVQPEWSLNYGDVRSRWDMPTERSLTHSPCKPDEPFG